MKTAFVISASLTSFSAVSYASDLASSIRNISRLGFDGVELHLRDPKEVDLRLVRGVTDELGLGVCAIGTGQSYVEDGLSLSHPDPETRRRTVQRLKEGIDFASDLHALLIVGLIRGRASQVVGKDDSLGLVETGLSECLDYAVEKGTRLVIEPINRYETDLLNTVPETLDFIRRVGSTNLGILLDTFHMNIEEPSICDSIEQAGADIFHVHTADSNRWAPGCGHVDFAEVVSALREVGYDGYLSAEILPLPDMNTAAETTIRTLSAVLGS